MKLIIDDIKSYIDKNFENPDLNVNNVAMKFNLSLSYMSRHFKRQMNMGMAEYISSRRINKAKYYLKNTDYHIGDILYKVGFGSSNVFVRVFKKYEGITPGQYRKENNELI